MQKPATSCALCKKTAKEYGNDEPEVDWALYAADGSSKKPLGDSCGPCYETLTWFFPWKTWEGVVEDYEKDKSFATIFNNAKAYREEAPLPVKDKVVEGNVSVELEIQRHFSVASENDLRRSTGLARVPARTLKFLPMLTVPKEDGKGMESVYAFSEEGDETQFRKGVLTVRMGTELHRTHLPAGFFVDQDHTQDYIDYAKEKMNEFTGLKQLLDKQAYMPSYKTWRSKKLSDCTETVPEPGYEEMVADASSLLEGPAAAAATAAAAPPEAISGKKNFFTPPGMKRSSSASLLGSPEESTTAASADGSAAGSTRQPSLMSLFAGSSGSGGASLAAPSIIEDPGRGSAIGSEETLLLVEGLNPPSLEKHSTWLTACLLAALAQCCPPGGSLAEWKAKVPLAKVADGSLDGRAIVGLKKCVARMSAKNDPDKVAENMKLNAYVSQVEMAEKLVGDKMHQQSLSSLHDILDMLVSDGVAIPARVKMEVVKRLLQQLLSEKKWKEMLPILNPFLTEPGVFDHRAPTVQALATTSPEKVKLFQKYIFMDLLAPLIVEGERCKDQCSQADNVV
eukprot:3449492-Amphidinium_carterae.2